MNGVHDMGGMENLGPITPEPDEPVFHDDWEARVHALTVASPTRGNIDEGRHQRELIPGAAYLAMTYYEKWFAGLSALLVKHGHLTAAEIASGKAAFPKAKPLLAAEDVAARLSRRGSYVREAGPPAFGVGDRVRTRNLNRRGHTRLPRYARDKPGVIVASHGAHVFPDSHAHGDGEDPRHLYTVRIMARDLWGEAANPRDSVSLDLWEPYLERA
ncbi:MAG: nitrile hydratase subunit beta [Proteobacteria bacterium]|nr:nitrile hydratase subunit beta [Pseudomonadota bacterium]